MHQTATATATVVHLPKKVGAAKFGFTSPCAPETAGSAEPANSASAPALPRRRPASAQLRRPNSLNRSLDLAQSHATKLVRDTAMIKRGNNCIENPIPNAKAWNFKWCTTDSQEDYSNLDSGSQDRYNHFQNHWVLTTKFGLTRSLQTYGYEEGLDIHMFFPRCYNLARSCDRADFIMDYRRSAALKVIRLHLDLQDVSGYWWHHKMIRDSRRCLESWLLELRGDLIEEQTCDEDEMEGDAPVDWNDLLHYASLKGEDLCPRSSGGRAPVLSRSFALDFEAVHGHLPSFLQQTASSSESVYDAGWGQHVDEEFQRSLQVILDKIRRLAPRHHCWRHGLADERNLWIVKPGASSKGFGISVESSLSQVLQKSGMSLDRVVQKYVERPLLLMHGGRKRKFDLRQWVLVKSFDPLQAYLFSSAYLRFCNEEYDLNDLAKRESHLSNWSVNKKGSTEAASCVAPLAELKVQLQTITGNTLYWEEVLAPQIKQIVETTLRAAQANIVARPQCFELYGFDILIDEVLQPWLLEVNLSPACEARTPWLSSMLQQMSEGLLDIVLPEIAPSQGSGKDTDLNDPSHRHSQIEESGGTEQRHHWVRIVDDGLERSQQSSHAESTPASSSSSGTAGTRSHSCSRSRTRNRSGFTPAACSAVVSASTVSTLQQQQQQQKQHQHPLSSRSCISSDLVVTGRAVNLRLQRKLDSAWRRWEAAQSIQTAATRASI